MSTYNIADIKVIEKEHVKPEALLTGDIIKGLDSKSKIEINAEIENNEWIQFPDGLIQKVVGETHEKGGVKMNIPDGTKVVSDHLTLTSPQVKDLSKEFGLNLSTKDTYATAIEKYSTKIGLKKLNAEQEDYFTTLKKELEKTDSDPKTTKINLGYISEKINDTEKRKKTLEEDRTSFFNKVFDLQESGKSKKDTEESGFKKGGTSKHQFETVCKMFGISTKQGEEMMRTGGYSGSGVPMFEDAGTKEGDPVFKFTYSSNTYKPEERVQQKQKSGVGYGNVKTTQDALQQLYNNFPDIVKDTLGDKYISVDEKGVVTFKGGIDLGQKQDIVLNLQKKMNDRMNASASTVINDESFSQEERDKARAWMEGEQFTFDVPEGADMETRIRAYDSKLGQFTAGRTTLGVDLVTPDDLIKLQAKGIKTFKQITPEILATLSKESKARYEQFSPKVRENADFFIDPIGAEGIAKEEEVVKEDTKKVTADGKPPKDDVKVPPPGRNLPRLFFQPDQSALPPSPMDAHLKGDVRLERVDPIRVGIENQVQEITNQRNFVVDQLEGLPDSQRAAVLANLLANSNKATNEAIGAANVTNAQNISQAELFNIGQSGEEQIMGVNNALSYEERQFKAKANTEESLRNYYDYNRRVNIQNFENQQKLNLMDSLFPDYKLDFMGATVSYDPNSEFQVQERGNYLDARGVVKNQTVE